MNGFDDGAWRLSSVRVTKYNPLYRVDGRYTVEEWTDYSDVGAVIGGQVVTLDEYLDVEQRYIDAIMIVLRRFECAAIRIVNLEKNSDPTVLPERDRSLMDLFVEAHEGCVMTIEQAPDIARLVLRNYLWCEIHAVGAKSTIRFGWDYYMYFTIGEQGRDGLDEETIGLIQRLGLFVE